MSAGLMEKTYLLVRAGNGGWIVKVDGWDVAAHSTSEELLQWLAGALTKPDHDPAAPVMATKPDYEPVPGAWNPIRDEPNTVRPFFPEDSK